MIALVIVADGDQQRFVDTFADIWQNAPMSELHPKTIVDASNSPEHRDWLNKHYGKVFVVVDIADYPTRPEHPELRVPVGQLLEGRMTLG